MKHAISDELLHSWTPQQLLAVYDFCQMMGQLIWELHEEELLAQMIEADRQHGHEPCENRNSGNLELPFDDIAPY